MNIHYQTTDIEMSDALSEYIDKRMASLEKFFENPEAHVHLRKEPPSQKSGEGLFHIRVVVRDQGQEYQADHASHDMYVTVDKVKDDLQRVIRKERSTQDSLFKRGARRLKSMLRRGE